jgi:hypothetical protein
LFITMLKDVRSSRDVYRSGDTYDVPELIAKSFIAKKRARPASRKNRKKAQAEVKAQKDAGASEENKDAGSSESNKEPEVQEVSS